MVWMVDTGSRSAFMVDMSQPEVAIARKTGVPVEDLKFNFRG